VAELSGPWLSLLALLPAFVALAPRPLLTGRAGRRVVLGVSFVELLLSSYLAFEFQSGGAIRSLVDPLDPARAVLGRPILLVDELSSLLLPFGALLFAFVLLGAPRAERARASVRRILSAESIVLGTFMTVEPWLLALLWSMSTLNAYLELRSRGSSPSTARGVGLYMAGSAVLFGLGVSLSSSMATTAGVNLLLLAAVLIRKGVFPFHSWVIPLFEHLPLGAATLFAAPQIAAYAAVRLILPSASPNLLSLIGLASLATAIYGAGLALVQDDVRRALGAFFMSQSALVMAGLDSRTAMGLAGGLALWISTGVALAGFTLTIAALEARRGKLSLARYAGGYERKPLLAVSFLVLGLASVGFPGTLGFAGEEALAHGAFTETPFRGALVLLASALNGITVMRCYFVLFCGARTTSSLAQSVRFRERVAFLVLVLLLLFGGLFPQPFFRSRQRAAEAILDARGR
jgi:NADH-quinone oxidoreductase subunit M